MAFIRDQQQKEVGFELPASQANVAFKSQSNVLTSRAFYSGVFDLRVDLSLPLLVSYSVLEVIGEIPPANVCNLFHGGSSPIR